MESLTARFDAITNFRSRPVDGSFCRRLPKVELHAHLTGSIAPQTLHEIWQQRNGQADVPELEDPLAVMSTEKEHFNVNTFFPLFDSYVYKLVDSAWAIAYTTKAVLQDFFNDGVSYLELRTTPRTFSQASISKEKYVDTVLQAIDEFVATTDHAMPTYLILSIDRRQSRDEAMQTLQLAASLRQQGKRIVGVDLCGNPARPLHDLRDVFAQAHPSGLNIALHFAEIPASSSPAELETLLSYQPDRLGHVIHVPEGMRARIAASGIPVELCLSCNVLAGLTEGGFEAHHLRDWRQAGASIALSTDDVGVFGSSLSKEYLLAAQHFNLSGSDLVALARSASRSIFTGEEQKQRLERLLDEFCQSEGLENAT